MRRLACWWFAILPLLVAAEVQADFLIYKIPGSGGGRSSGGMTSAGMGPGMGGGQQSRQTIRPIILPGKITVHAGKTVTYQHPTIKDKLYFRLEDVEIRRAATPEEEYRKKVGAAGRNAEEMMKAAVWALKRGLLTEFYSAINKTLDIEPNHEAALKVVELKKKMDVPLADNPQLEKELRGYVKASSTMRIETSKHFILLTDTPERPEKGERKNRAQKRLDLLEQVYQSFLLLFHAQDVELDIPRDRLKVVLFQEHKDFFEFATSNSPALASASGFWGHTDNTGVFFDHGTTDRYKAIQKVQEELNKLADDAKKARTGGDLIRFVRTLDLLQEVERENSDISVVSHEATHQMAGNTGLLPRHVAIPSWVHEGLATYFEAPGDATWAGIGAVNEERLTFYRALAENDREHSNIDFIVGDQIFDFAGGHIGNVLHGYGQAWALTHFLLENHLKEFVAYYRMLGEMPPNVPLSPSLLTELFDRCFGSDHKTIDQEWRRYMRSLKTDVEKLEESTGKKT